jgi:hypothetical protein
MLRKFALAAAATTILGLAALAPTAASAHGHGGGFWHGGGFRAHGFWGGPRYAFAGPAYVVGNPCIRPRWVPTPWGPRLRRVNVCY